MDTIGQHVRGGDHIQAQKNKGAGGILDNQLTIQSAFTKGVLAGTTVYPPSYVPKPADMPCDVLHLYCETNICHGFHKYFIRIGDDMVDVCPLLNDVNSAKEWYPDPDYRRSIIEPFVIETVTLSSVTNAH